MSHSSIFRVILPPDCNLQFQCVQSTQQSQKQVWHFTADFHVLRGLHIAYYQFQQELGELKKIPMYIRACEPVPPNFSFVKPDWFACINSLVPDQCFRGRGQFSFSFYTPHCLQLFLNKKFPGSRTRSQLTFKIKLQYLKKHSILKNIVISNKAYKQAYFSF